MSAQDNRRVGRALVCGALLVYGCLRIPAAAQPAAEPQAQELQKRQQDVCQLEAPEQQIRDQLGGQAGSVPPLHAACSRAFRSGKAHRATPRRGNLSPNQ